MLLDDSRPILQKNHIYENEGIGLYIRDISEPKSLANNKVKSLIYY